MGDLVTPIIAPVGAVASVTEAPPALTADPQANPQPKPQAEAEPEPQAEPQAETPVEPQAEPQAQSPVEPAVEPLVEPPVEAPEPPVESQAKPQPKPQGAPQVKPAVKAPAKPAARTQAEPRVEVPVEPMEEPVDQHPSERFLERVGAPTAARIALPELGESPAAASGKHLNLLLDIGVDVAAVVGTRELKLEQVMAIRPGTIIDLDRHAGEPIELYVNGKPIALAEIVVVDGRLGARVVEVLRGMPHEAG